MHMCHSSSEGLYKKYQKDQDNLKKNTILPHFYFHKVSGSQVGDSFMNYSNFKVVHHQEANDEYAHAMLSLKKFLELQQE